MLRQKPKLITESSLQAMESSLEQFTPDFMEARHQGTLETRVSLEHSYPEQSPQAS